MEWFPLGVAAALLGAILGSFLNAVLFRFNTGRSALRGRSQCMHCSHPLSALDLVPLVSFVVLCGRCRYCGCRLSVQYPVVEAAGALLAVLVFMQHPEPLLFALHLSIWMTLLFVVVYDLRHNIIPWSASGLLAVLALLHVWSGGFDLWALAAGPLLAAPLFLFSLVSRGTWMGWGDGTLELGLGWFLGLTAGLSALVFAFWIGAAVGIILMIWARDLPAGRQVTMKSEVPFAPFLVLGVAVAYFCNVDIFQTLPALFL